MIDSKLSVLSLSDPTKLQKEFKAPLEAAKAAEEAGKD